MAFNRYFIKDNYQGDKFEPGEEINAIAGDDKQMVVQRDYTGVDGDFAISLVDTADVRIEKWQKVFHEGALYVVAEEVLNRWRSQTWSGASGLPQPFSEIAEKLEEDIIAV